jgi:hypothetical protein
VRLQTKSPQQSAERTSGYGKTVRLKGLRASTRPRCQDGQDGQELLAVHVHRETRWKLGKMARARKVPISEIVRTILGRSVRVLLFAQTVLQGLLER